MGLFKKPGTVFFVLVLLFLAYSVYLYANLPVKTQTIDDQAQKGKLVWQQYNCNACHQVYGLGGFLGPDLTNSYSKKGPAYIKAFLQGGTVVMPNFHLSEEEMAALISYLKDIDQSGISDPRTYTIKTNGTIEQ